MKKTRQDSTVIRNWTNRTFSFRNSPSNFYSGTKALAEEAIREIGQSYLWRPRLPFNEREEPCNWLRRLQRQATIYDHINSISHLEDFVKAALDLWEIRAPFGIYNVTNPGAVTTREVVEGFAARSSSRAWRFKIGRAEEDPARARRRPRPSPIAFSMRQSF